MLRRTAHTRENDCVRRGISIRIELLWNALLPIIHRRFIPVCSHRELDMMAWSTYAMAEPLTKFEPHERASIPNTGPRTLRPRVAQRLQPRKEELAGKGLQQDGIRLWTKVDPKMSGMPEVSSSGSGLT